jgi:predicted MPP superfamily phosphohydrolase
MRTVDALVARTAAALRRCGVRYRLFRRHSSVEFPEIEVAFPGLPEAFDGFRIAQISDLHYNPWCEESDYDRLFRLVAGCEPDLCVVTGDNVSCGARFIGPIVGKLASLRAPHGAYAVLGNHDYREDANETARCYEAHGIKLLVNEWDAVTRDGQNLIVAGIDDHVIGRPDLANALSGVSEGAPVVLLSHVSCAIEHAGMSRVGLVLSGHTHGGQINFPLVGPLYLPVRASRRRLGGYHRTPHTQLYISRGVGVTGVWFRWRAQPEVPTIVLRRGGGPGQPPRR